ncbi:MAG: NAD kinase [Bacteroides sp.]|nr:NAD kinase [Bacteroides sp.]
MKSALTPTVAIYGNSHQNPYLGEIAHLLHLLRRAGVHPVVEREFAGYLQRSGIILADDEISSCPPPKGMAAISLGGDGTFLRTARWIGPLEIPVLGINTGHLGFLSSYSPAESAELVGMLCGGDYLVESRMALRVDSPQLSLDFPYALNEVAVLRDETASMLNIHVGLDGQYLADYLADGLLISTPTGSTGYSLSVGGPIIFPGLDAICIAPIAPHTLTARPVVVAGHSCIRARTTSRAPRYRLSLDGVSFLLPVGAEVTVTRADFSPRVIRRKDDSFASTLRRKLLWGVR